MISGSAGLTGYSLSIPSNLPPITQIGDRIVQIRLPMTGNPMRYINGYLLEDDDGLTLIDYYSALADYQGRWLSSTYSGSTFVSSPYTVDGVHPSGLGHYTVTQQAISEGLAELFSPAGQILTSRSTAGVSKVSYRDAEQFSGVAQTAVREREAPVFKI